MIKNRNIKNYLNRVGETNVNKYGSKYKIIKYKNARDIIVEFDNGYIKRSAYKEFKNGNIKSPFCKSVYGVGYIGIGEYKVSINSKSTDCYNCWSSMLGRVTGRDSPCYKGCVVCNEWLCYQNFAKWWHENYYNCGEKLELDKDIKIANNKIYSPNTCLLVPHSINSLFCKSTKSRGKYPLGISKYKNLYLATVSNKRENKSVITKAFKDFDKAREFYISEKKKIINKVCNEYIDKVPKEVLKYVETYDIESIK